jgi:hypothetical protein
VIVKILHLVSFSTLSSRFAPRLNASSDVVSERRPRISRATFPRQRYKVVPDSFPIPHSHTFANSESSVIHLDSPSPHLTQLNNTKITLSPLRNILLMKRSLFTGRPLLPSALRGISVHISFTFSRTMLQCRSKALQRASNLRLFRQLMRICVWLRTAVWRSERGPLVNSCVSSRPSSYSVSSPLGLPCSSLGVGG